MQIRRATLICGTAYIALCKLDMPLIAQGRFPIYRRLLYKACFSMIVCKSIKTKKAMALMQQLLTWLNRKTMSHNQQYKYWVSAQARRPADP